MNMELFWKIFIEMLRKTAEHRRAVLCHDIKAEIFDEIATAAQAALEVVEKQEKPRDQWTH